MLDRSSWIGIGLGGAALGAIGLVAWRLKSTAAQAAEPGASAKLVAMALAKGLVSRPKVPPFFVPEGLLPDAYKKAYELGWHSDMDRGFRHEYVEGFGTTENYRELYKLWASRVTSGEWTQEEARERVLEDAWSAVARGLHVEHPGIAAGGGADRADRFVQRLIDQDLLTADPDAALDRRAVRMMLTPSCHVLLDFAWHHYGTLDEEGWTKKNRYLLRDSLSAACQKWLAYQQSEWASLPSTEDRAAWLLAEARARYRDESGRTAWGWPETTDFFANGRNWSFVLRTASQAKGIAGMGWNA